MGKDKKKKVKDKCCESYKKGKRCGNCPLQDKEKSKKDKDKDKKKDKKKNKKKDKK